MPATRKFFLQDLFLTIGGVGAAALALAGAFFLSRDVTESLGYVQREGNSARVLAVLRAIDQEIQHLTDYTTGYAMWDDSYRFVQKPGRDYIDSNYTPSVMFVSPVRLVVVYNLERKVLFSRALDEDGKVIPVAPEVASPGFSGRFTVIKSNRESLGTMAWLGHYGYLLSVCPVTDSSGTQPIKGYLLFGRIVGARMMERVEALTSVRARAEARVVLPDHGVEMDTPTLGIAHVDISEPRDGHSLATAAFAATEETGSPMGFEMELPARVSNASQRLSTMVRTFLLIVTGAFALFVLLVGIETARRRRELRARMLESERFREARDEADRLMHKAESADRAKSAFLAMMSHEIRTPLNAIIGYAELLRTAAVDHDTAVGIQTIRDSGGVLLRVLNDVLDFSKIEAGELTILPEPVRVRELVSEICGLFGASADAKSNRLIHTVDSGVPECLLMDGARVRQVLSNLLSNAVKFTDGGGIEVDVRWEETSRQVRFVVRDEGIGISPDAEKGLFQPFIQADSATSRRYDGSGLGLAICRRLCQLMGGDIAFEPPNGRGAMFSFHIPATRVELSVKESAAAQDEPGNARGLDVMVVDDNLANARLMNSILKRFGVAPRIAPGGREAIESYVANPPDLILMDIQMPEVDGFQAAREIRRIEAEGGLPRCRIIAVTADILENCRADALKAGMDGYLTKPVRIPDIQALVEQPWPAAAVA